MCLSWADNDDDDNDDDNHSHSGLSNQFILCSTMGHGRQAVIRKHRIGVGSNEANAEFFVDRSTDRPNQSM